MTRVFHRTPDFKTAVVHCHTASTFAVFIFEVSFITTADRLVTPGTHTLAALSLNLQVNTIYWGATAAQTLPTASTSPSLLSVFTHSYDVHSSDYLLLIPSSTIDLGHLAPAFSRITINHSS